MRNILDMNDIQIKRNWLQIHKITDYLNKFHTCIDYLFKVETTYSFNLNSSYKEYLNFLTIKNENTTFCKELSNMSLIEDSNYLFSYEAMFNENIGFDRIKLTFNIVDENMHIELSYGYHEYVKTIVLDDLHMLNYSLEILFNTIKTLYYNSN